MLKKQVFLAIGLALAVGASARADQMATNVTLPSFAAGAGNAPNFAQVGEVAANQANGLSYTTTTSTTAGSPVYATGANLLSGYSQVPPPTGSGNSFIMTGDHLVFTYAIQGTQNPVVGPGLAATFQKAVVAIYDVHATVFNAGMVNTWGPNTPGAVLVYSGTLLPPSNTTPFPEGTPQAGQPSALTPASAQNVAAFNPVLGTVSQGNVVFSDVLNNVFLAPFATDGLQLDFAETNSQGTPSPGDALLDSNWNALAALIPAVGLTANPFTTTGFTAKYNQNNAQATGATIQTIGFNIFPTISIPPPPPPPPSSPEPASMLIWAGVAVGFGIYRRTRRSVKKA